MCYRILLILLLSAGLLPAQSPVDSGALPRWYVFFEARDLGCMQPVQYAPEAAARRLREGIPLSAADYPLDPALVARIQACPVQLRYALRWHNCLSLACSPETAEALRHIPGVQSVEPMALMAPATAALPARDADLLAWAGDLPDKRSQTLYRHVRDQLYLDTLTAQGITGKDVLIAVLDAGFKGAGDHPAVNHLHQQGRILATRDFYQGKPTVYRHSSHGAAVLGCIAGMFQDSTGLQPIGAATGARFILARTESKSSEKPIEEDCWLAAMEWADSLGARIISSSLGYTDRYAYTELDGKTTLVTRAAAMAVRRGILVVNSQGNEGSGKYHWLGAPADADSVLSIGGTMPMLRIPIAFSSFGPNARGVMKPDISAPGLVVSLGGGTSWALHAGTSFSCPLISGLAAAIMELHPDWTALQVREELRRIGHLNPYFDYRLGLGVPDARLLFRDRDTVPQTFDLVQRGDSTFIVPRPEYAPDSTDGSNGLPVYVHTLKETGALAVYMQGRVSWKAPELLLNPGIRGTGRMRIWYEGYLWEED